MPKFPSKKNYYKYVANPYDIEVFIFKNKKHFIKAEKHYGVELSDLHGVRGRYCELTHDNGTVLYLVGCFDNDSATLVHELFHVNVAMANMLGIRLESHNNEAIAYLIGDMYSNAKRFIDA